MLPELTVCAVPGVEATSVLPGVTVKVATVGEGEGLGLGEGDGLGVADAVGSGDALADVVGFVVGSAAGSVVDVF